MERCSTEAVERTSRRRAVAAGVATIALVAALFSGSAQSRPETELQAGQGPSQIWAANQARDLVHVIEGATAVGEIDLAPGARGPHILMFSPNNRFAYVASEGNGAVTTIRISDRTVAANLVVAGGTGAQSHQAVATPDGARVFLAHRGTKTLYELQADAATGALARGRSITFAKTPLCTVFDRTRGKAYVSFLEGGIAIVDTVAFARTGGELATAGTVQCSMEPMRDGTFLVGSNGGAGHLYRLDPATDTLTELRPSLGAVDRHGLAITQDERRVLYNSRGADRFHILDLATGAIQTISLDVGPGAEMPDQIDVNGSRAYVALRGVGKVAMIDLTAARVEQVIDLGGTNLHDVRVLDLDPPVSRIARPRSGARLNRKRFRRVSGTVADNASFVSQVELAVRAKKGKRCRSWHASRRRLVRRSCARPLWFPARGRERWSYRFGRRLPEGTYQVRSRARDSAGNREGAARRGRNLVTVRLR